MNNEQHNKKVWKDLRKFKNRTITVAVRKYALELERLVSEKIDAMGISDTGDLRKSIKQEVFIQAQKWVIRVGSNMEYAVYVHEGTRPHWPPKSAIDGWVRRKLGLRGVELETTSYLIRRKISKEGTKEKPFMQLVFDQEKHKAAEKIARYAQGLM